MNAMKIITIICWIITAVVLAGLVVWFLTGSVFGLWGDSWDGNWSFGLSWENITGPFEVQGVHTANTTGLDSISIQWVAGEITVIPHDGNEIQITESAQRELRDDESLTMSTDGGTLTIRFRERGFSGRMPKKNLEVLVPHELSANLAELLINSTSGSIMVDSFEAAKVDVTSVSGSIGIYNTVSQNVGLNTTSGTVSLTSVRAGRLDANSVSGAVAVNESFVTMLDLNTTSGSVTASGEFDRVNVGTISGSTTIRSTTVPSRVDISSVSGGMDIYVPNYGEITVSHSAVSGRFSSDVPVIMQSGAAYNFSSVSGSTRIHALD